MSDLLSGKAALITGGAIINMSSISGKVGLVGQTNYSAAQAGIVGLTKAAAKELGEYQMNWWIESVVKAIQAVKADDVSPKLQKEFYEKSTHPLDTQP